MNENNQKIAETLGRIRPLDTAAMKLVRQRLDTLTKPPGSLGRLEEIAIQLAGIRGESFPPHTAKKIVVMAADHGITAEGVSAYPSAVTAQMVANFVNGGAAINVLARLSGAAVRVVDIGVASEITAPGVTRAKVRPGTANFAREAAMSRDEALQAIAAGIAVAEEEVAAGTGLLGTGEMGIGNTTASSAVMAALTGCSPRRLVGPGTGIDEQGVSHKTAVVERALAYYALKSDRPLEVLSTVGGLEIAGLAGLIIGGAAFRCPVVVDGFISTVAALVAVRMNPVVLHFIIPSHLSQEPGHALLLEHLELKPYLHMNMRLGEGTGAALTMHLVEGAARILAEMATFAEAGVSNKEEGNACENLPGEARTHGVE
ncbi:MAG: nicotinate-nucleotide--dimethylbenzimidazole phosphoribosyltransferase [Bacillota bacterium]